MRKAFVLMSVGLVVVLLAGCGGDSVPNEGTLIVILRGASGIQFDYLDVGTKPQCGMCDFSPLRMVEEDGIYRGQITLLPGRHLVDVWAEEVTGYFSFSGYFDLNRGQTYTLDLEYEPSTWDDDGWLLSQQHHNQGD